MFVAVELAMNVIDVNVAAVGDVGGAVADSRPPPPLLLCLYSMGSGFEHISFSRAAKQIRCEP